ncbi:TolC family protein [Winogradskyella alexanderae]|uniref:TolC family protein n=1 Tax=Winogradskyella alexanderae TaxID=2877123 RepID=A0ABS7XLS4_9FLAO|nr:TolC family protein [Winogradskyella alexanderae]MCA0130955.1 TolC family protein [Winogradskyella alexanderae]
MKKSIIITVLFFGLIAQAQVKKWTLLECVEYALENNISIQQSELDVDLADIDKNQAFANFLPNLNSNASYNINTGANINPATNQFENTTFRSANGGVSSGVNLSSGFSNWKTLQRAKINKIASEYRLDKMKDDISLFVANSFLQILANREQLKVLRAQNVVTKENLKNTQDLVDAGVLPQGDLLELMATDATQAQQIIAAENNLFISKFGLAQTLQLRDYENFDIVDDEYGLVSAEILNRQASEIADKAKEEINDVKIAQTDFELAAKDLQIARADYFPTIRGFVGYNTRWASTQTNPFTGENIPFIDQLYLFDGTSVGFQLNVPIFNGFSVRNNVQRRKVSVERFKYQLEQAELDLENTVYQAYNDAKNSKKTYEAALKTEEARRLAFEYAKERYDVGLSNAFDFNQSRTAYENAQSDVVRTKYDYIFRLKILEFYFGLPITDLN